ncbi:hypothetical protein C9374_011510 [Naegleria lovaniensis]|uniref:Protein-S-isoprenylcysteine O-methyltransferase n=1 Tax=Naegleria lovaniensis TaxID=51637 RepID=A0AA88KWS7_NAELO|nr:uncharacterized protein C9374_011510 [Naegleria lovaniensis]KAG2392785.1 hypothetical protein C9374_011510 [Naegleria lovaniensis]
MELVFFAFLAFAAIIALFHAGEWLTQYMYNRSMCSINSLAIEKHYMIAMSCAILEYIIESIFFPSLKTYSWICYLGIILALIGDGIRKCAMITAGMAFTHLIQERRREGHNLITHGIYSYVRHPGYLGWFIWAPATQLILMNPFCVCAFTFVAWQFFYDRIPFEEETLVGMFGKQYEDYRKRVPSYIPFVDALTVSKK